MKTTDIRVFVYYIKTNFSALLFCELLYIIVKFTGMHKIPPSCIFAVFNY